jgi:hypothetical protein
LFNYTKDKAGELHMEYSFGGLLKWIPRVVLAPGQMNMYTLPIGMTK